MKWIGQHIYDLVARFRDDVYLEDLSTTTETSVLVVDSSGKVSKSTTLADDLESDVEASIDTLANLTSFGSAGATTNIVAGDLTMYNPVNDGNPTISLGKDASDRFRIETNYLSGTQTIDDVIFRSFSSSAGANAGEMYFNVDGTNILRIFDDGIDLTVNKKIQINSEDILTTSGSTCTLSNIDALDTTTISTFETAMEANLDTLSNSLGVKIDTDRTDAQGNAGAENITALHIDFDREAPDSGTYAHNDRGIDLDVNSRSLGTSSLYGMDIDVVGHTSGTSTAYGIDLNVSGADKNIGIQVLCEGEQLRLSHNASDYAMFTVADTGDLTITTVGDGARDSDLILAPDGQIKLEPESGSNILLDGTLTVDAGVVVPEPTAHDAAGTAVSIGAGATTAGTTNNIAGGALTIHGGQGKGSGAGGDIVFKTANASGSGSSLNSLATALTISDDLSATFAGAIVGDLTGQADTVATIAGLAPNTATTQATQPNIESIGTDGDTLNIRGDIMSMTNASSTTPVFQMYNTTDDNFGPRIVMVNNRGAAGQDGDEVGKIQFGGYDDQGTPGFNYYAQILAEIHDATSGEESGKLTLSVANHDAGMGAGLILTGGSVDNEIDVTVGYGAASVVTIPGDIDLAGDIDVDGTLETDALTIGGAAVLAQATASAVGAVELATDAEAVTATDTTRAVTPANLKARVSQIVNLKGYATLQDGVYDYANGFPTDDEAPFQMTTDYGSGTIGSGTEVTQSSLFRSAGFHVPFACTISALQVQATCNEPGDIIVALVEYRPSEASPDQNDYPRTVYETVTVASNDTNNKVKTVTIASGDLDNTAVPAGSHLMIMVKGDGTSATGTAIISASIGLSW